MTKQLRVFDIGTPWGVFDVMSSFCTKQRETDVINNIIVDLQAGKKIKGINA